MTNQPAVFANPEGSPHLGPYRRATKEEAASGSLNRPIRVYADGIYDLFHPGHARQFQQCKNLFPNVYLIVGCCNDKLTHAHKGKTVNTEWERYEALSHCRYVDEIIKDAPWSHSEEFLEKHRIDFVAHDEAPYGDASGTSSNANDLYQPLREKGMFCATQRTEGVSTSDLITRIIKNYDMYVRRQLKRGISAEDLKLSKVKAASVKTAIKYDQIKTNIKEKTSELKEDILSFWTTRSHVFVERFLSIYQNRIANNSHNGNDSGHSDTSISHDNDNDDDDQVQSPVRSET